MFNKMMTLTTLMASSSLLTLVNMKESTAMEVNFMYSEYNILSISLLMSKTSMTFMFMVSTVTTIVLSFSSVYMESYNKKKFFVAMSLFFYSMMILSFSNSLITTITGWDGLGMTSIILILTYQNNTTISNSMLTMFFNRVGDLFMFSSFYIFIMSMNEKFNNNLTISKKTMVLILIFITAMTKSAQVPLSAWLPAAMSAPTPISAMVHSSTLVTAGVYMLLKMYETMKNKMNTILTISCLTLMMASISANMEKDLKKIVAFSTMSQISIIMIMYAMKMKYIAMAHMINHAMFKTLTFTNSGMIFLMNNMNQDKRKIKMITNNKTMKASISSSMLAMSGMPFSTSFFSKDKLMELMKWENKMNSTSLILSMASVATILYSKKIMSTLKTSMKSTKSMKKTPTLSITFLSINTIIIGSAMNWAMETANKAILNKKEVIMINLTSILSSFLKMKKINKKIEMLSNNLFFMKWITSNLLYKKDYTELISTMDNVLSSKKSWSMKKMSIKHYYSMKNPLLTMIMIFFILLKM